MVVIEVIEVGFTYLDHLAVCVEELHFEVEEVAFPHVVWRLLIKLGRHDSVGWPVCGGEGCELVWECTGVIVHLHCF